VNLAVHRWQTERLIRVSAVLALVAIALMAWGLLGSGVVAIMVAMTVGQGLGTLSLLLYLVVLVRDLRRSRLLKDSQREDET
jgi:hypothetical protein